MIQLTNKKEIYSKNAYEEFINKAIKIDYIDSGSLLCILKKHYTYELLVEREVSFKNSDERYDTLTIIPKQNIKRVTLLKEKKK